MHAAPTLAYFRRLAECVARDDLDRLLPELRVMCREIKSVPIGMDRVTILRRVLEALEGNRLLGSPMYRREMELIRDTFFHAANTIHCGDFPTTPSPDGDFSAWTPSSRKWRGHRGRG
jgi:hypothetical protein